MRRLLWLLAKMPWPPAAWLQQLARFTPWTPELFTWLAQTTETFDVVAGMTIVFEPLILAAQHFARQRGMPFVIYPLTHLGVGPAPGNDAVSRFYTMRHQVDLVLNSAFLIAINEDEADFYRARGLAPDRTLVAGPGIELAELAGGDGARLPVVGVLSAMAYDKGTVHVVEAVRALWRQGCAVDLVLAGAVLTQFQQYLDTLPADERSRIVLLGPVDHQTKLDLLAAIDMLALPSRTDSFGIVFLEAWAYGKPVIAAEAWGVRTVINAGQDGLLVPFGDVEALARAIRMLAADAALRRRLGETGRAKVQRQHTWQHKYPRIQQVYARLSQEGSRAA
jgi:glycosyltransferase involved in cell wall biosynthesis